MDTRYLIIFVCLCLISEILCAPASTAERMWLVKARQRRAEKSKKIDAALHMLVKRWCLYCDSGKTDSSSSTTSTTTPTSITTTTTTSTTSPTTSATQQTQTTRCTWRNWWKCLFRG